MDLCDILVCIIVIGANIFEWFLFFYEIINSISGEEK